MLTASEFHSFLSQRNNTLILDGALATELESRGHDLKHALWSGTILENSPSSIQEIHRDYYLSGADIAITASYQTSTRGIEEHLHLGHDEAIALIKRSVQLAKNAREEVYSEMSVSQQTNHQQQQRHEKRRLLVAGSVGPYGAFLANGSEYTGNYDDNDEDSSLSLSSRTISKSSLQDFHRPRIRALIDAGVDLLALETMPHFGEILALLDLLSCEFPEAIGWISCTVRDEDSEKIRISDGTDIASVLTAVVEHNNNNNINKSQQKQIVGFGVNCISPENSLRTIQHIADLQRENHHHHHQFPSWETRIPLVCYPNSGETWDGINKKWENDNITKNPNSLSSLSSSSHSMNDVENFVRRCRSVAGTTATTASAGLLIGGCCRTGPKQIQAISKIVREGQQ